MTIPTQPQPCPDESIGRYHNEAVGDVGRVAMQHHVENARAQRKRKQYQEAVSSYNKAITRTPTAQLFDERADCHTLLGDLGSALKDAKASIQHAGNDPIGYLRAGLVLQKMDKKSVAYEVMSRGLKRVKHTGQSYEALRKAHGELTAELAPRNSIDPLTLLSRELALMVLDYLSFRQIVAIMRVSKDWNKYIRSIPGLWTHLDFSGARTRVKPSAIRGYIKSVGSSITKLTLNNLADFETSVHDLLRSCPVTELCVLDPTPRLGRQFAEDIKRNKSLRVLHLPPKANLSTGLLRSFVEDRAAVLQGLSFQMNGSKNYCLQDLDLPEMLNLNIVDRSSVFVQKRFTLHSYANLPSMKKLRQLTVDLTLGPSYQSVVDDLSYLHQLEHLEVIARTIDFNSLVLPNKLRFLSLHVSEENHFSTPLPWYSCKHDLPLLRTLKLTTPIPIRYTELDAFLGSEDASAEVPSQLESLHLSKCRIINAEHGRELSILSHPRVKGLKNLCVSRVHGWDDYSMQAVGRYLPKLEHLEIHYNLELTGVGIKAVLEQCPLQSLKLIACESISPDAIAWARSQKVRVTYQ